MAVATTQLTKGDLVKYPFTREASDYIRGLGVDLDELLTPAFHHIIKRAITRIEEAVKFLGARTTGPEDELEIITFPIALMLISQLGNDKIKARYALAEAKRAYDFFKKEAPEVLLHISTKTLGWRADLVNASIGGGICEFALNFIDYIRNSAKLRGKTWKLVNRVLSSGRVYLTKRDYARLMQEEVFRSILGKISGVKAAHPALEPFVEELQRRLGPALSELGPELWPKAAVASAIPPCMRALLQALQTGKHIPHVGRFAMAAFLLNIGIGEEELVKMLHALTDFNPRVTRYQVEHIAGKRGSRTRYVSPSCKTMQTHGLCVNPDELCTTIRHPLSYYRKKLRIVFRSRRYEDRSKGDGFGRKALA